MRYTGPKIKLSRRLGVALSPKAARIMEKKPYGPGLHGPNQSRFKSKMSVYKTQLFEKQKIRFQYNISERQMRNYFNKAASQHGNTGDNLIHMLECRLDAMTLRSGFAPTIFAARQSVGHGHIRVNGKKVTIPSYQVKPGDVLTLSDKAKKMQVFIDAVSNDSVVVPAYLERNTADMTAKLVKLPSREEIPILGEVPLVVEFYSR